MPSCLLWWDMIRRAWGPMSSAVLGSELDLKWGYLLGTGLLSLQYSPVEH